MISRVSKVEEFRILAAAILDTIPDPFVILDSEFVVLMAGRSFYRAFRVQPEETVGRALFQLGGGRWDIQALRSLLSRVLTDTSSTEAFEIEQDLPELGPRVMVLTARRVVFDTEETSTILLLFEDVTARRADEAEKAALLSEAQELLRQKNVLLQELQHRVANSLQIIASILLLKARAVSSEETRHHLEDARQRVMTVAAVQRHLSSANAIDEVDVNSYLSKLCESLAASMVGDHQPIDVVVHADPAKVGSADAVNLGLIVTELLINAIKHAYPTARDGARIAVSYEVSGPSWQLSVADNGVGSEGATGDAGLGTSIVKALADQLGASVDSRSTADGLRVSITKATFSSRHTAGQR